jgi:hypothetical protein
MKETSMVSRRELLKTISVAGIAAAGSTAGMANAAPKAEAKSSLGQLPLSDEQFVWRAVEAMIWGMPAVNLELMFQASRQSVNGQANQITYWSRLLDWKNQTLTPNSDVVYLQPFYNTRDAGPVVIEIPPADDGILNGTLMDAWQSPHEDVGPAGLDAGKGGRYLILPPDYAGQVPEGYHAFRSPTYGGYGIIRSILRSGSQADLEKAVAYGKRIRLYPLSAAHNPPPTTYLDASGALFDSTIPFDLRFFEHLARCVQNEPWLPRDRAMIDSLRMIGIEKGKPFAPDEKQRKLLNGAARQAHTLLDAGYERLFDTPFAKGSRWAFLTSPDYAKQATQGFPDPNQYPTDERGLLFTLVWFTPRRLGDGMFWIMTHLDAAGGALDGSKTYRLRVPPKVPINQYWSLTLYDRHTHAFIREMPYTSRSSQTQGLRTNQDGSVDLYMGTKAPKGWEANWLPTNASQRFEAMMRFYGPEPALFNHSWVLPDIERIG